jgi:hypothetical protein
MVWLLRAGVLGGVLLLSACGGTNAPPPSGGGGSGGGGSGGTMDAAASPGPLVTVSWDFKVCSATPKSVTVTDQTTGETLSASMAAPPGSCVTTCTGQATNNCGKFNQTLPEWCGTSGGAVQGCSCSSVGTPGDLAVSIKCHATDVVCWMLSDGTSMCAGCTAGTFGRGCETRHGRP